MFKAIVVFVSLTGVSFQLEDELGPYSDEAKCLYRGAQIIKVTSQKVPLLHATVVCLKQPEELIS